MSVQCVPPILFAPRIWRTSGAPSSKNEPVLSLSIQSKSCVCVFLSLERARSHLCHVGSVCSSHLVCSTHLEDKRGALEQERTSPFLVDSVKVLCVCFFKPRESKIPSVPCRFSVFLPSCLLHASRGQAWRPRARTNQSFPCRFSQSVVCVSLNLRASTNSSMPCRFNVLLPSCLLHASRGQAWRPRASTNQSLPCRLSQSVLSVFLNP